MIGQTVDQYKISQSLGRNPVAETFLAEHVVSGESFVLKLITPQLLMLSGFKDRLIADASSMIDWHHPRVLPLENILDDGGRLFLVQRFVESESLAKVLRDYSGAYPLADFSIIASDVLNALEFLHKQGVVPRFLNPRKIMIQPDGHAFLRDMGIEFSKAVETYRKNQNLVPAARFYAPERFVNADTMDVRHNIYSFGIVMFQMATGKIPYGGNTFEELQQRHSSSRIPSPIKVNPGMGEELSAIILKAMAKRPEDRYQSVEELRHALGYAAEEIGAGTVMSAAGFSANEDMDFGFDLISEKEADHLQTSEDRLELDEAGPDDAFGFDFAGSSKNVPAFGAGGEDDGFDLGLDNTAGSGGDLDDDFNLGTPSGIINLDPGLSDLDLSGSASPVVPARPPERPDTDGFSYSPTKSPESGPYDDFDSEPPGFAGVDDFSFGDVSSAKPGAVDEFRFEAEGGFGGSAFEFDNDPLEGGKDVQIGAPTQESDVFDQPSSSRGNYSLSELDDHDPSALEAAFDRELNAKEDDPFSSLDSEVEDHDPFAALGVGRDRPPEPDPGGDDYQFGTDLDATNPDEGFDFGDMDQDELLEPTAAPALPRPVAFGNDQDNFEFDSPDNDFNFEQNAPSTGFEVDDMESEFTRGGSDPFDGAAAERGFGFPGESLGTGASEDIFGFAEEPKGNNFSMGNGLDEADDFGFGGAPAQSTGFGFEEPEADGFGFGESAGLNDDFNFDAPAGGKNTGFGFDESADSNFGFEEPAADDAFGFGSAAPADGFHFEGSGQVDEFGLPVEDSGGFNFQPAPQAPPQIPVSASKSAPSGLGTEDGAFSFEEIEEPPPLKPVSSPAAAALAGSLAAAEEFVGVDQDLAKPGKDGAKKKAKPKVVRKYDLGIVAVTAVLGLVVIGAIVFWFMLSQRKKHDALILDEISKIAQQNKYETALKRIQDEMGNDPSSSLEAKLKEMAGRVRGEREESQKQVETLMQRAEAYEKDGVALKDGVNDALGTYVKVLAKDPENRDAAKAIERIKQAKTAEADAAVQSGNDLSALAILSALVETDSDKAMAKKYNDLKKRLSEVKAGELTKELDQLFAAQRYNEMVEPLMTLNKITPNTAYIQDMRKTLVASLETTAQEHVSRKKFDDAERSYGLITDLDPKNQKALDALAEVKNQRLVYQIQVKQNDLSEAIQRKNLRDQYRLGRELAGLDPGNFTANSALGSVGKEIASMLKEAQSLCDSGQFKKAAQRYKEVYDINGDQESYALYNRYVKWTPPPGMAIVPFGEYGRGDNRATGCQPFHQVNVSTFFIDKTEVTNRQFEEFVKANPNWSPARIDARYHDGNYLKHWIGSHPSPDDMDRPVVFVSWFAARAYATWIKKRLPTEAEWEKAARGNTVGQNYWWGEYSDANKAVYELYAEKRPARVGSFPPNAFEVYEILGNVNEWVEDTYDANFYSKTINAKDPVNRSDGAEKVLRGGSYKSRGRELEVFMRFFKAPTFCHATVGFRCARDANDIH